MAKDDMGGQFVQGVSLSWRQETCEERSLDYGVHDHPPDHPLSCTLVVQNVLSKDQIPEGIS